MKNFILTLFILIILFSCTQQRSDTKKDLSYSFFVAGHTYGNKSVGTHGFHPPFKSKFPLIQKHDSIKFGVLTGDIVFKCDTISWDIVDQEVEQLGIPVFFVAGNHDVHESDLFKTRYSDKITGETYYSFYENGDLFIVLDANIDRWWITGLQLDFLKKTLSKNPAENHIFIFVHQLIWWDKTNEFSKIIQNVPIKNIPVSLNYWTDIEPLLKGLPNSVFLIAGDLCADKKSTPFMYHKKNNITYIASGMGNEKDDNFLFVNVFENGDVQFDLNALQGDPNRFGKLEDYHLP